MLRTAWLIVGLLCSLSIQADEVKASVIDWLGKMQQAAVSLNYQGVVVLGNQQRWDSYQIRHAFIDEQEYEFIEQLSGQPQQSIRHNNTLLCIHSESLGRHLPLKNPLHPQASLLNTDFPYRFILGKPQRVAGRTALQIMIRPMQEDRYGANLWLDEETGLLLRSELLDQQQVLVRAQFVQLEMNAPLTQAAFVATESGHSISLERSNFIAEPSNPRWLPSWLPEGFKLQSVHVNNEQATRLLYFDGLVSFSVFVDAAQQSAAILEQQWSATAAVVLEVNQNEETKRVTAVGELPLPTLKKIAQSMQLQELVDVQP